MPYQSIYILHKKISKFFCRASCLKRKELLESSVNPSLPKMVKSQHQLQRCDKRMENQQQARQRDVASVNDNDDSEEEMIVDEKVRKGPNIFSKTRPKLADLTEEEALEYIDKILGLYFFGGSVSFRQVENPFFVQLVEVLLECPYKYKLPNRHVLGSTILDKINEDVVENRDIRLRNTESVLLVDGWKNKVSNEHLLVFTARNENTSQTFVHAENMSSEQEDETGESLTRIVNKVINICSEKYNTQVYAVKSDNDSKIKRGQRNATADELDQDLWLTTCASHSGNRFFSHFESEDTNFYKDIREIIATFRDPLLSSLILQLGGKKLKSCPDTRFCYLRDSILSVLNNLRFLRDICELDSVTIKDTIKNKLNCANFEAKMTQYLNVLTPFSKFINVCQGPSVSIADSTQYLLELKGKMESRQYDQLIDNRVEKALNDVCYAANLLHYKYQGRLLTRSQLKLALDFLKNNLNEAGVNEYNNFDFRRCPYIENCNSPIAFWKFVANQFPNLAKVAVKLMVIPGSTAILESLFSEWKFVHNIYRNNLKFEKSCKLIGMYHDLKHFKRIPI